MAELHCQKPFSSLQRLARIAARQTDAVQERCDFCSEAIPHLHQHLLNVASREMVCTCRACSILFNKETASQGTYKLVPDRCLALEDFLMSDLEWERMRIPVGIAFFVHSTASQRVMVFHPSPMGPTESLLEVSAWARLQQSNPMLSQMERDVEALLVNRARGELQCFLVPIDECYRLVGIIRLYWKGLSGGQEVWKEIKRFFDAVRERSRCTRSESP